MEASTYSCGAQRQDRRALQDLLDHERSVRTRTGSARELASAVERVALEAARLDLPMGERLAIEERRRDADLRWRWLRDAGHDKRGHEIAHCDELLTVSVMRHPGEVIRLAGDLCLVAWAVGDEDLFRARFSGRDIYDVAQGIAARYVLDLPRLEVV